MCFMFTITTKAHWIKQALRILNRRLQKFKNILAMVSSVPTYVAYFPFVCGRCVHVHTFVCVRVHLDGC